MRHRPIGLGVQGLADVFEELRVPFDSVEARDVNKKIFETMYFAALTESCKIAKKIGPYETFKGSPLSKGIFHWELWNQSNPERLAKPSGMWDWEQLRKNILKYGVRNSLLIAPMPTASTSQILGNNECFEPRTSNIYVRRVLSGDFYIINKRLIKDLINLNLWNDEMKDKLIAEGGSIQRITEIPTNIRNLYKTVWDIRQKDIIDMAADRAPYIDQSQSMNIFMAQPSLARLSSMHFYAWKAGIKTGMYYLRRKPVVKAIQVTLKPTTNKEDENEVCTMEQGCISCGS